MEISHITNEQPYTMLIIAYQLQTDRIVHSILLMGKINRKIMKIKFSQSFSFFISFPIRKVIC